jgi:hypothetical protein
MVHPDGLSRQSCPRRNALSHSANPFKDYGSPPNADSDTPQRPIHRMFLVSRWFVWMIFCNRVVYVETLPPVVQTTTADLLQSFPQFPHHLFTPSGAEAFHDFSVSACQSPTGRLGPNEILSHPSLSYDDHHDLYLHHDLGRESARTPISRISIVHRTITPQHNHLGSRIIHGSETIVESLWSIFKQNVESFSGFAYNIHNVQSPSTCSPGPPPSNRRTIRSQKVRYVETCPPKGFQGHALRLSLPAS